MVKARWPEPSRSPERRRAAGPRQLVGVETRQRAQVRGRVEIDDQHVQRAVGLGLQLKAALDLERRAKQHRQRRRLADDPGDRGGIGVALEDGVDRRAEANDAAARAQRLDQKRHDNVVLPGVRHGARGRRMVHGAPAPRHQARMPFCACRRFSASSKTTDCGPSMTSSVTSSPRWAGRQCMKIASVAAALISAALT